MERGTDNRNEQRFILVVGQYMVVQCIIYSHKGVLSHNPDIL